MEIKLKKSSFQEMSGVFADLLTLKVLNIQWFEAVKVNWVLLM